MGHKTRGEALDELNDEIEPAKVSKILDEIGFNDDIFNDSDQLAIYYTAASHWKQSSCKAG